MLEESQPRTDHPRVSVLMPAYNAERYVSEAIESMLDQSFPDFELVVVDDGSTDGTGEIVERFADRDPRVRLVRCEENGGIARALNRGLDAARGEYIVRMDSDDWSYPYRLERQVAFMDANPEVDVSGSAIEVCDRALRPLNVRRYRTTDQELRERVFHYSPFAHPAVIYRTEAARAIGGYNPALSDADDYDFFLRLGRDGQFANLPDVLHRLRTRPDSVSQGKGPRTERLTIYTRFKAAIEYGYPMSGFEFAYSVLQYASTYVIPPRVKFWLFNRIRSRRD